MNGILWNRKQWINFIVIAVVTAIAIWGWLYFNNSTLLTRTYSLSGKVTKVENGKIYFEAGAIYGTEPNTEWRYQEKVILTTDSTKYSKLVKNNGTYKSFSASSADVVVGVNITITSPRDIGASEVFSIDQVNQVTIYQ